MHRNNLLNNRLMNGERFLEHIKRQGNKVATFLGSRDVVTFLLFLWLAFFMWYMYSVGTQREIGRRIPIEYVGIPENVILKKELPKKLKFVIKDEGKTIWSYNKELFDTVRIDLSNRFDEGNTIEIKYDEQFKQILSLLSPSTKVVELSPGYFSTSYTRLYTKSVPVMTSNVIQLAPQRVMYDTIGINPKFVTIMGTAEAIDTISYLYLEPIDEVFDKTKKISVKIQKSNDIELNRPEAEVTVPVEMCTEKEIVVPITIDNAPEGVLVRTFPSEVKVRFIVGLSHYNTVTEETFKVTFDYNDVAMSPDESTMALQLDYTSGYIFNIQLNPAEVEFLIEDLR